MVLRQLLQNLALNTAQSVSTYAQTSDARQLLLPARQLIKVPNTDGDKLDVFAIHYRYKYVCEALICKMPYVKYYGALVYKKPLSIDKVFAKCVRFLS